MVRWLRLRASTAEGMGSIPGQGTKIPEAVWPKNPQNLFSHSLEARVQNQGAGRAMLPAKALGGESLHCLLQLLVVPGIPWLLAR